MAYSRIFIALKQGCNEYARDARGSLGRCIIESKNGICRLQLQAQGLKSDCNYRVCILSNDNYGDVARTLYVDSRGKGEVKWEFNPKDIGIDISEIKAIAVLVKDKAPLIGFTDGEYNWQRCLMNKAQEPDNASIEVISADSSKETKETNSVDSLKETNKVKIKINRLEEVNSPIHRQRKTNNTNNIISLPLDNQPKEDKEKVISIINELDDDLKEMHQYAQGGYQSTIDRLFNKQRIKPFGEDGITWVKGNIKELCLIRGLWRYINNPFVIKCCRDFGHIIFGIDNKNNYWLGVPCKYDSGYKLEAMVQGFSEFKTEADLPLEEGQMCYFLLKC